MKQCLLFFIKYPHVGRVKTRLGRDISMERAASFYKQLVEERLQELSENSQYECVPCLAPTASLSEYQQWLGDDRTYLFQKGFELGARMEHAFLWAFTKGYERVVLAGSDIPALSPEIVLQGLERVTKDQAVLGPAVDGGYYLIGFHSDGFSSAPFHHMLWSHGQVLEQTKQRIVAAGLKAFLLPQLRDIDTLGDLEAYEKKDFR